MATARERVTAFRTRRERWSISFTPASYPANSRVLEAGCGVGAQTVTLALNRPDARIVSIDVSDDSLVHARARVEAAGLRNVEFLQADIFDLKFSPSSFDHVFVCFVLEHLAQPVEALLALKELLRPGGTITVIEGDHGSAYFHPDSPEAQEAILCLVALQRAAGGNALIGRQLYPLLVSAGFDDIHVSPRMVYVDASRPDLVEGFTKKTFTAMVEGVRQAAIGSRHGGARGVRRGDPSAPQVGGRRRCLLLHVLQSGRANGARRAGRASGSQMILIGICIDRGSDPPI